MTTDAIASAPSPWRTIWFSPRQTIRRLIDGVVQTSWVPVVALAAVTQAFTASLDGDSGRLLSASDAVMPGVIAAAQLVFGIVVGPFVLAFVGRWFGGDADPADLRQAIAWSYAPLAAVTIVWVPVLLARAANTATTEGVGVGVVVATVATVIAYVWSLPLLVIGVAEAQRFSIARAIGSILILAIPALLLSAVL